MTFQELVEMVLKDIKMLGGDENSLVEIDVSDAMGVTAGEYDGVSEYDDGVLHIDFFKKEHQ